MKYPKITFTIVAIFFAYCGFFMGSIIPDQYYKSKYESERLTMTRMVEDAWVMPFMWKCDDGTTKTQVIQIPKHIPRNFNHENTMSFDMTDDRCIKAIMIPKDRDALINLPLVLVAGMDNYLVMCNCETGRVIGFATYEVAAGVETRRWWLYEYHSETDVKPTMKEVDEVEWEEWLNDLERKHSK